MLLGLLASPAGAQAPPDDKPLATELLAQAGTPAREAWLAAHRADLTPGLGRELAAEARDHYLASRYAPASETYSLALHVGEIVGDPESRILGLEGLGNVERFRGRPQESLPFYDRAMQEAVLASDERAVGRIVGATGNARRMLGEFGAALALFERQLALFERLGDREWVARTEFNIGTALGSSGRCAEAIPHLEHARTANELAGMTAAAANSYNNLGICHTTLGNYAAALEAFEHCLQIEEKTGEGDLASPLNNIGNLYQAQGAPLRALDYYHRSLAVASAQGSYTGESLTDEGEALILLGRLPEARTTLDQALAVAEE
ncbi:MAG TPA: tetratricopeptide repeat protein, partial [Vicinamibacteria bacterium]|nr:tetratricopeptide repeat protein [Vicinamibacteria bacterium]